MNHNTLFYTDLGSINVSDSFIDHKEQMFDESPVLLEHNISFTFISTYRIQFYNSYHCNTDIHIEQSLYQSPKRTIEETIFSSQEKTIDHSMRLTFMEKHPRTYDEIVCSVQLANRREIFVVFSFCASFFCQMIVLLTS